MKAELSPFRRGWNARLAGLPRRCVRLPSDAKWEDRLYDLGWSLAGWPA